MTHRTDTGLYFDAEARAMQKRDRELIPRRLVIAMFSLALASVLLVAFAVLTDRPLVGQPQSAPVVAERSLIIEASGNAIRVTDATTRQTVLNLTNGGFISVVNDGLERARLVHEVTGNAPVTIARYPSGRMTLTDPETGWNMNLSSFGQGNLAHFERLLAKDTQ